MFLNKLKEKIEQATEDSLETLEQYIDLELGKKRHDICNNCEFLTPSINRCKQCGCIMTLKTKIKTAKCPIGKW